MMSLRAGRDTKSDLPCWHVWVPLAPQCVTGSWSVLVGEGFSAVLQECSVCSRVPMHCQGHTVSVALQGTLVWCDLQAVLV
jgi:hypothetical protein